MKSIHHLRRTFIVAALAIWVGCSPVAGEELSRRPPRLIAHAGGGLGHRTYTNSLQALEASVALGHTLLELDFSWTRDGRLVLKHDWDRDGDGIAVPEDVRTLAQFLEERRDEVYPAPTLGELGDWMRARRGFHVVTDVKSRNLDGLALIARELPDLVHRFVPQIYQADEWQPVRALGFERIILTLYAAPWEDQEVLDFAAGRRPWAVTMPFKRAFGGLPGRLAAGDTFVYVHTVNDWWTAENLAADGVGGVYTDWLTPSDAPDRAPAAGWPAWTARRTGGRHLNGLRLSYLPQAEMPLDLSLTNRARVQREVVLVARNRDGEERGRRVVSLEPGEVRRLRARDLVESMPKVGVLLVRAGDGVDVEASLRSPSGLALPWSLQSEVHGESVFGGPGAGLAGHMVILANPRRETVSPLLECRVDGEISYQGTVELPPLSARVRVFGFRTDGPVEVSVRGEPVVVQHLRWNAHLTFMR